MACQYNKHIQCLHVQGWAKIVHQELPIASHTISIALDLQMYIVHISILYIYVQPSCPCGEIMIPISRSPPSKSPSRRLSTLCGRATHCWLQYPTPEMYIIRSDSQSYKKFEKQRNFVRTFACRYNL